MLTNLTYINFTVLSALVTDYGLDFAAKLVDLSLRKYLSFIFSAIPSYLLVMDLLGRTFISSSIMYKFVKEVIDILHY